MAKQRSFRKYHRWLAPIMAIPLTLTILTGMTATLSEEWSVSLGLSRSLLLRIHTGEVFHLEAIYPLLNGLGLAGLLITGLSMSGIFSKKPSRTAKDSSD